MGTHEWVDIAGYIFAGATGILSTFLGYRLVRHDQERKELQETLRDFEKRLAGCERITDIVSQNFRLK